MGKRSVPDWLTRWEYAHRGRHGADHTGIIPENSLAAAARAIATGMGIECDIQRTSDDVAIVFHDWDTERLLGHPKVVKGTSATELATLNYPGSKEYPAQLAELLDLVAGRVPILIEIKSKPRYDVLRSCEIVAQALQSYTGPHAVMSFDPRVAKWFRRHHPKICTGLVMREDEHGYTRKAWQRRLAFWIAKPDFLAYHIAALPNPWVAKLRAGGLPILTWTVNSPETRERALVHADALVSEGDGLSREEAA